ncbi:uncharacterized protein LOC143292767 [Babylonia areolata]|uniref:uncharacterized protein LOC143292767 n=1 Tax=Babylonia areolata TaxID=304850 RepID=UPI003FD43EEB
MEKQSQKWCEANVVVPQSSVKQVSGLLETVGLKRHCDQKSAGTEAGSVKTAAGSQDTAVDVEVSKEAVMFMDLPEHLIQMVTELQHLEPALSFTNAQQLYERVDHLRSNPQLQVHFGIKHYNRQLTSQTSASAPSVSPGTEGTAVDVEVAKAAVIYMDFPEPLVQLVIDLQHLEPELSFTNAQQLYERVHKLCRSPRLQRHYGRRLYLHQQASKTSASAKAKSWKQKKGGASSATSNPDCDRQKVPAGMSEGSHRSSVEEPSTSSPSTSSLRAAEVTATCSHSQADLPKPDVFTTTTNTTTRPSKELKQKVRELAKVNRQLLQRQKCRGCREVALSSSGVTFLPCGHFLTCESCSEMYDDCPACGKAIMATVRTFLS